MKKLFSLLCIIFALVCMISINATETANLSDDGLWTYASYGDGVVLTAYHGSATDVYVPSSVEVNGEKLTVIKLGDSVFENNDTLNSATLGVGILEIGDKAFYDADNLVCILLAEETTTLGAEVFYSCDKMNSIILYDAVTTIGENAFAESPELTVWCNAGTAAYTYVTEKGIAYELLSTTAEPLIITENDYTFYIKNGEAIATSYTGSESTVIVPTTAGGYPVTELRETFRSNSNLVKATVSKGIRIVGQYAFFNCDKLESVILPISVVSIGSNAFYSCNALEQIALPENLKIIEEKAFAYCTALVNISLPDNVTAIGNRCFQYCRNLIEITILGNITHIPDYTFANCDNLEKITIPACVTEIGDAAFAFCSKLTDLSLPNNLEVVGDAAFFDVLKCATIEVPVSLASMTKESFHQSTVLLVEENSPAHFFAVENDLLYFINSDVTEPEFYTIGGITYVVLKESAVAIAYDNCTADIVFQNVIEEVPVTEILDIFNIDYPSIFNMTSGRTEDEHPLVSVVLPDELKSIRNELFLNCGNLSNVTISHGITSIGTRAFEGCPIKSIVIPDSVINIGEYAFYECVYLENIALSVNLQSIGENAFGACTNLFEVLIPENVNEIAVNTFPEFTILLVYDASYAHVFAEENTLLFFVCDEFGNAEIYTIDGIVYGIMNEEAIAIGADSSLTSIVMPDAVEGYPVTRLYRTFYKCSSLVDITLPSELKSISDRAFFGCSGVTNITLPESLESIGKRAFYGCKSLISVVIPQNVSEIYDYPNESFPEEVILLVYENSYAHTLAQKESILHLTYNDKTLLQFCFVDGIYYVIKDDEAIAIKIDDSLTSITIPSVVEGYSVTELYATFSECTFLVSVSLPSSLKVIGDYTFNDCTNLTLITLPPNLITIGKQAFGYCTKLTSIVIPEGVTFIGEDAFQWCRKLDTITIPKSITYIGESAFWCCDSITTVLYQGDTDSWLEIIFANGLSNPCNSETASLYFNGDLVTDIVVTEGSSIPAFAFRGCQSIKSVTLSESVTQIGTSAFNSCVSLENITLSNGLSIIYGALLKIV